MRFGSHVSIKGGYLEAAKYAFTMNAGAFQYFPKNPRSLIIKEFDREDAQQCKEFCIRNRIISVSHSPYPTTLTPQSTEKRAQVIKSLLNDLEITEACGSIGIVVHFGKQINPKKPLISYQLMIDMLNNILNQWNGNTKILLENSAGIPGSMGTTLEELVQIRNLCDFPEKIGFCLDTCHAFASGLWDGENWGELLAKGREIGFFKELKVIHLNNSKYPLRQGKDRHAPIFSSGFITVDQFDTIMQTPELKNIPFILETPKEEVPHEQEIQQLQEKWGGI